MQPGASFTSVRQATDVIRSFIDACNCRCVPSICTKAADETLTVAEREATSPTDH